MTLSSKEINYLESKFKQVDIYIGASILAALMKGEVSDRHLVETRDFVERILKQVYLKGKRTSL